MDNGKKEILILWGGLIACLLIGPWLIFYWVKVLELI